MDIITIADLVVFYHVGVPADERVKAQRLLLTVEMETDFSEGAATDDVEKTVDYYAVSRRLLKLGEGRSWNLIESLAVEVADSLLNEFKLKAVTVEVKKFVLPETRHVSVKTRRVAA
jgi:7,8-dihydroneopterin aldolase/epimerase/oxygenase